MVTVAGAAYAAGEAFYTFALKKRKRKKSLSQIAKNQTPENPLVTGGDKRQEWATSTIVMSLVTLVLLVLLLYVYGLKYAGYIISGVLLLIVLTSMLSLDRRPPLWAIVIFSVVVTLCTYYFFEKAVHVLLPSGVWMKPLLRALR